MKNRPRQREFYSGSFGSIRGFPNCVCPSTTLATTNSIASQKVGVMDSPRQRCAQAMLATEENGEQQAGGQRGVGLERKHAMT
jgi:hypothetical protein